MEPVLPAGARLLVSFRAGRLVRDGTMVKPDTRKGLLRVLRAEDGLLHVEWWSREDGTAAAAEYDEIVFPDEASFQKPAKAPPRVFMIKFKEQPDRDVLFWMQEPSEAGDDELCRKVDRAINTPMGVDDEGGEELDDLPPEALLPADALLRGHISNAPGAGDEVVQGDSVGMLPQGPGQEPADAALVPQQLGDLIRGMTAAAPPGAAGNADPGASLAAALLAAIARREQGQAARAMAVAPGPGLSEVLKPDVLSPLLQDPEVLERLATHLPEEQRSREALQALAHSPQFHQQLQTFSAALQTGQLDLAQFGLSAEGFTVADFLRAIQALVDREQRQQQQEPGSGQS